MNNPPNDTEQPLGDATIQITYIPGNSPEDEEPTALLTVRAKDQDLTEPQMRALGEACLRTADRMRQNGR